MRSSTTPHSVLRTWNDRRVFDLLSARGTITRRELCDTLGVSKPAATALVERLVEGEIVAPAGQTDAVRPGPRAERYRIAPSLGLTVGVEATHDRLGLRARRLDGTEVMVGREHYDEADLIAEQVTGAIRAVVPDGFRHVSVSIALPGAVDPATGDILHSTELPHWRPGTAAAIRASLGAYEVDIDNEVNLRAEAEHHIGVAQEMDDFLLVALGSGIGAALVLDGRMRRGRHGAAGELGRLPLGQGDSFQDLASGWNLAHVVDREHDPDFGWARNLARAEDADGWRAVAAAIVPGLRSAAVVVDPAVIVLAGELARVGGEQLRAPVGELLQDQLHWPAPTVLISALGDDAVLEGCLWRARERMVDQILPVEG